VSLIRSDEPGNGSVFTLARYQYDFLIKRARLVDGTGNPWRYGDVALSADRVASVALPESIDPSLARKVIQAEGMIICPGFVDILSQSLFSLLRDPRSLSKVTQGVTTEVVGEGSTPAPFGGRRRDPFTADKLQIMGEAANTWHQRARKWCRLGDWLEALSAQGTSVNVGSFIGGGTVREFVKGHDAGPASPAEVKAMQRLVASAMEDGALGLATALIYSPGAFARTEELMALAETAAAYGGVYATHLRSEGNRLLEALEEAIEIGRRAQIPVEIFHLKAAGRHNWRALPQAVNRIEVARASGLDVTADMYPYVAAGTGLTASLPPWAGDESELFDHAGDPVLREQLKARALQTDSTWENLAELAGPDNVMPLALASPEFRRYRGKSLERIAADRRQPWIDTILDLLASERQDIFTVYRLMNEKNQRLALRRPWMKISSDAAGYDPKWAATEGPVHPRSYGTFPRVLGRYVRENGVLTLEEAIRKMTSAPAKRLGLVDRGLLHPGMAADVVILDPEHVRDRATYREPHQLSTGILHVWINGVHVLRDGSHTGALPGRHLAGIGART
jgi:N-acyl-D-amino-acid deacylase